MNYSSRLTSARIDAGLSQSGLAKRVRLSQSYISQIESGKRVVSPAAATRIAYFFDDPSLLIAAFVERLFVQRGCILSKHDRRLLRLSQATDMAEACLRMVRDELLDEEVGNHDELGGYRALVFAHLDLAEKLMRAIRDDIGRSGG